MWEYEGKTRSGGAERSAVSKVEHEWGCDWQAGDTQGGREEREGLITETKTRDCRKRCICCLADMAPLALSSVTLWPDSFIWQIFLFFLKNIFFN